MINSFFSLQTEKKIHFWYIHDISTNILVARPPNAYGLYYTVWERWKVWLLYCPYNAKILHGIDVLGTSVIWAFLYKHGFWFRVHLEEMIFCSFMGTSHAKTYLIQVFVSETWSVFAVFILYLSVPKKKKLMGIFFIRDISLKTEMGGVSLVKLNDFLDWNRNMRNLEGAYSYIYYNPKPR